MLRKDATLEAVGSPTWFDGNDTCLRYLAHVVGRPGDWLMLPTARTRNPPPSHTCAARTADITRSGSRYSP